MVMASIWDLASRINARRVLLWVCVCCLALLSLALLRSRVNHAESFALAPMAGAPSPSDALGSAQGAPTESHASPTVDPFASRFLTDRLERAERLRREEEQSRLRAQEPPPKMVETAPPPVQGPPRPEAKLLYRGMFSRPDGSILGLVENQRSNRVAFHRVGDEIEGLTIGSISRGALELVQNNEVKVTLNTGIPASFQPE